MSRIIIKWIIIINDGKYDWLTDWLIQWTTVKLARCSKLIFMRWTQTFIVADWSDFYLLIRWFISMALMPTARCQKCISAILAKVCRNHYFWWTRAKWITAFACILLSNYMRWVYARLLSRRFRTTTVASNGKQTRKKKQIAEFETEENCKYKLSNAYRCASHSYSRCCRSSTFVVVYVPQCALWQCVDVTIYALRYTCCCCTHNLYSFDSQRIILHLCIFVDNDKIQTHTHTHGSRDATERIGLNWISL